MTSSSVFSEGDLLQGRYHIVRQIGAGGMGAVYEGENKLIKRRVAIKVMHAQAAGNREMAMRFEREAQAAGQIGSDHITEVLDLGEFENGDRFIVMEFLDGESLAERYERRKLLQPQELIPLIRQTLEGLGAAHEAGIVHRDIKPDNVFILNKKAGRADFVKLLDFGVSKFKEVGDSMNLTRTGAFVGTPYYISPEQASGKSEATALSDLYSVGVMLYQGLTGELPYNAAQFNHLIFKIALEPMQRPVDRIPGFDPGLDSIICRAMAKSPEYRFASAQAFIEALDKWTKGGLGVSYPPAAAEIPSESLVVGLAQGGGMAQSAAGPEYAPSDSQPSVDAAQERNPSETASPVSRQLTIPTTSAKVPLVIAGSVAAVLIAGGAWVSSSGDGALGDRDAVSAETPESVVADVKASEADEGGAEAELEPRIPPAPSASASQKPSADAAAKKTPIAAKTPTKQPAPQPAAKPPAPRPKTTKNPGRRRPDWGY